MDTQLLRQGLQEIGGKTLGLVGFGHIGRAVAVRARAFDMPVVYCNWDRGRSAPWG